MGKAKKSVHELPVDAEEKVDVEPVQEVVLGDDAVKEGQVVDEDGQVYQMNLEAIQKGLGLVVDPATNLLVDEATLGKLIDPATSEPVELPVVDIKDAKAEPILDNPLAHWGEKFPENTVVAVNEWDKLKELTLPEVAMPEQQEDIEKSIQDELNALKAALIRPSEPVAEREEEPEHYSKVHAMHEDLGMAGSRNAFPINKDSNDRLGQRKGMFIGLPNRHHRKHLKPAQEKLADGVFKIDNNRPVNN